VKLSLDAILEHEETRWSGVRELLLVSFPIIIAVGSNTVMSAVDAAMMGWLDSDVSSIHLAAIGPAAMLNSVMLSFFIGVLSCVNTFVGQSYGRGNYDNCSSYTWQGIHMSWIMALAVLILWLLTPGMFSLINHSPAIQHLETTYFRMRLLGIGGAVMTVALSAFFQATSRPVIPMIAIVVSNVINFLGNYLLIFGNFGFPAMGIGGAALASNIAAWFCALAMMAVFLSHSYNGLYNSRRTWRLHSNKIRQLFNVGWPAGLLMGMDAGSWTLFVAVLVGSFGDDALAAGVLTGNVLSGSFMPTIGLGIAVTALVSQWIGRKNPERAKSRFKAGLVIGILYMTVMGLVFVVFGRQLANIFSDNPAVIALGRRFLIFAAAFQFVDATCIITSSALKAAGDTRWPLVAGAICAWGIFLPLGYILSFHTSLGVFGGWAAAVVYIYVLATALFLRFRSGKWKKINIFGHGELPYDAPEHNAEFPHAQDILPVQPTHAKDPAPLETSRLEEQDDSFSNTIN